MSAELNFGRGLVWENELVWWECSDCNVRGEEHRRRLLDHYASVQIAKEGRDDHNRMLHGGV